MSGPLRGIFFDSHCMCLSVIVIGLSLRSDSDYNEESIIHTYLVVNMAIS